MAWSTAVSIGRIINGIAANPMHVGSHLPAIPGILARLDRCPAAHVMRLITNPGIMTDANICHTNTSPAVFIAGTIRWSPIGFCNVQNINTKNQEKKRKIIIYLVCCDGFINAVTDYISNCHTIAQMYQSLWDEWS